MFFPISFSQFVIKFRRKKQAVLNFFLCQAVAVDDTNQDDDTTVVLTQSKVVAILTRKAMYVNIIHN